MEEIIKWADKNNISSNIILRKIDNFINIDSMDLSLLKLNSLSLSIII